MKQIPRNKARFAYGLFTLLMASAVFAGTVGSVRAAGPAPELLDAEKAFSVTARRVDDKTLELRYEIADGYYLYRDRFRFSVNGQPLSISTKGWPRGKWKQDVTFGRVVTYRNSVHLLLPVSLAEMDSMQSNDKSFTLTALSQGCADAGVCYPPLRQILVLVPGTSAWVGPRDQTSLGFSEGVPSSGLAERLKRGK